MASSIPGSVSKMTLCWAVELIEYPVVNAVQSAFTRAVRAQFLKRRGRYSAAMRYSLAHWRHSSVGQSYPAGTASRLHRGHLAHRPALARRESPPPRFSRGNSDSTGTGTHTSSPPGSPQAAARLHDARHIAARFRHRYRHATRWSASRTPGFRRSDSRSPARRAFSRCSNVQRQIEQCLGPRTNHRHRRTRQLRQVCADVIWMTAMHPGRCRPSQTRSTPPGAAMNIVAATVVEPVRPNPTTMPRSRTLHLRAVVLPARSLSCSSVRADVDLPLQNGDGRRFARHARARPAPKAGPFPDCADRPDRA